MPSRWFFVVVIGAIVAVLAIFAIIVWVQGDNEDNGKNTGHDPYSNVIPVIR
jgi:hypothetical protein